ncbi:MAG: hypothetical protein H0U13_04175 [Gemmatimonadaceae bacterium]|nr:hypothetical protein [Gemmatimonadaceae bacterium]
MASGPDRRRQRPEEAAEFERLLRKAQAAPDGRSAVESELEDQGVPDDPVDSELDDERILKE